MTAAADMMVLGKDDAGQAHEGEVLSKYFDLYQQLNTPAFDLSLALEGTKDLGTDCCRQVCLWLRSDHL